MDTPLISVITPVYDIPEQEAFLARIKTSLDQQTYRHFEWVITDKGKMAENTNAAIKEAKGDIIKILFMDDYLVSPLALQHVADMKGTWMASGCLHDSDGTLFNPHIPVWNDYVLEGRNTLGSPSVIAFKNIKIPLMDEKLSWLIDCDWYYRMWEKFGEPELITDTDVAIGVGPHQATNTLDEETKLAEHYYLQSKYL